MFLSCFAMLGILKFYHVGIVPINFLLRNTPNYGSGIHSNSDENGYSLNCLNSNNLSGLCFYTETVKSKVENKYIEILA